MDEWKVPLSDIDMGESEIATVTDVLRSNWLTMGDITAEFERVFARYIGVEHAIAVTNCTAALQLAFAGVGIGAGDEVIMPSLTFAATANAAVAQGGVPVFVDVINEEDLTVSPAAILASIGDRTRAIAVVHYAGYPCAMQSVLGIAKEYGLAVIEDCAHSPGALCGEKRAGSLGDVGCFSFFGNKNMTTGEGGMVTTNDAELAQHVRLLRSHGVTVGTMERHRGRALTYDVVIPGFNFRIDEIRSALGLAQLAKLEAANERREVIVHRYRHLLGNNDMVTLPFANRPPGSAFHLMPVLLKPGLNRRQVMESMRASGVQTSIHYPPVHTLSYYAASATGGRALPVTEAIKDRLLSLPLYPTMTSNDIEYVVHALEAATSAAELYCGNMPARNV